MRRTILLAVLAGVAALCVAVAPATGAPPTAAQFNALKSKVNRLQTQVTELRRELGFFVACTEDVIPVARFGGLGAPGQLEGYMYGFEATQTFGYTSALDVVDDLSGLTPGREFLWYQIVNPQCVDVSTGRATLRPLRLPARALHWRW